MQLKNVYEFGAPVERVWAVLMDTTAIASCLPGCRELRHLGEDRYQAELVVSRRVCRSTHEDPNLGMCTEETAVACEPLGV